MPNKKKTYPHNYQLDTKSVPQRNRMRKLLDNAAAQQQLVSFTNNLKQKQIQHNYRSESDRIRGELGPGTSRGRPPRGWSAARPSWKVWPPSCCGNNLSKHSYKS